MSDGPKGQSALRDSKKWLDSYLDGVRDSWAKDTKQLSSLTFRVRDCDRKGKTDCKHISTTHENYNGATLENYNGTTATKALPRAWFDAIIVG